MTEPVKTKRKYAAGRRAAQAADTRDAVIAAARRLFVASGWQGTTIAGIAREAAVSSETIYAVFGNKQSLLKAVLERSIRREEPAQPLLEQAGPQAIAAAPDQSSQLALFATDIADVLSNVAELMAVVRTAAETDPALAELYRGFHAGRRHNLEFVAAALLQRGPLRHGMEVETATAIIWRLASPELYLLLTRIEGLDQPAYAGWLRDMLTAALLA